MVPHLALSGFMGSGKSAVGRALAARLGIPFIDLDREVEALAGAEIEDIFDRQGEDEFRRLELMALTKVLEAEKRCGGQSGGHAGAVLGLGGGTVTTAEARAVLRECCHTIWLQVELEEAWRRARGSGRPLARDAAAFERLYAERRVVYGESADWSLDTRGLDVHQVASRLELLVDSVSAGDDQTGPRRGRRSAEWAVDVTGTERESRIWGGYNVRRRLTGWVTDVVESGRRAVIITDQGVAEAWRRDLAALERLVGDTEDPLLVLPQGETSKSVSNLCRLWETLAAKGLRRDDVVVVVGGGVIGDLGGFAAATYLRGIHLWQVPTSVIAQVDSSVGGKVAVNLPQGKNLLGTFYQPDRVLVDPCFLITLPQAEVRNGLGEVVKYALLLGREMFEQLESQAAALLIPDPGTWSNVARRCIEYKQSVVARDERDQGERAVLNLGHTTAHALERTAGFGRLGHGVAVGLGLLVALHVSEELLDCSPRVRVETAALLQTLGLPTRTTLTDTEAVMAAMNWDKKADAHGVKFVGLRAPGSPVVELKVPAAVLRAGLEVIRA